MAHAFYFRAVAYVLLIACVGACKAFDPSLIEASQDASTANGDAGDLDGSFAGRGGQGGASGAAGAGAGGQAGDVAMPSDAGVDAGGCEPAPPDADPSCLEICPERCNGADDDCDERIDEGQVEDLCPLAHAVAACIDGECFITECIKPYRNCDDRSETGCEATDEDVENCGTCGNRCSIPGAVEGCVGRQCVAIGCEGLLGDCDGDSMDCESALTSLDNCGECGQPCEDLPHATALSCAEGACVATSCALGYDDCNDRSDDGCEQLTNTIEHCGGCGVPCDFDGSSGDDCDEISCRAGPCDEGFGDCDGLRRNGCERLNTTENCEVCGQICGGEELANTEAATCASGACELDCAAGFASCDNYAFNGCETSVRNLDRCGDCETPCAPLHATGDCASGSCEIAQDGCDSGWADCNDDPSDGCETSLNDDDTCGGCDIECVPPDPVCAGSRCGDVTCAPGFADCAQDGFPCENDLSSDEDHCGACDAPCEFAVGNPHASALSCIATRCEPTCAAGFADCNGDYRDGCERPLNTLTDCGSCNTACAIANATESCTTGQCLVTGCAADFRDCDGDMRSCERPINTVSDCGACNAACSLPNASAACEGSPGARTCAVGSCTQFFEDCDDLTENGCEVNLQTDTDDCGACGYDCNDEEHVASATCSGGSCAFTCDANFRDCNNVDTDGCETSLLTNTNCGGCGVACARTNASASCSTGTCQITSCNSGYGQCDGNTGNGCESLSSLTNCGGCGQACLPSNATGACGTGSCEIASCAAGWEDCDGDVGNGCERNTATLGPCLPDESCVKSVFESRDYFVCPTVRNWSDARARCQMQLYGDLARIDSRDENVFVRAALVTNAWLGGTDGNAPISSEGQFRWANDTALFWTGVATGTAPVGVFTQWQGGEPNDHQGNEDCLEMYQASGNWNDQVCSTTRPFVCEVAGDLCPSDPGKTSPGQCGCGVADVDDDGDRTMNCIDGCPTDAAKLAAGVCGCNVSDVDGDSDGTPNCNDGCPTDGNKTAAGQCGCNIADSDSDSDETADCNDACPTDGRRTAPPCAFPYDPSNYDPDDLDYVSAPNTTLSCSTTVTINTSGAGSITGWCGASPTFEMPASPTEPAILPLQGLTVPSGTTVRVTGTRPLIFSINGDATIGGVINARGLGTEPGAGGNNCGAGAVGDNASHDGGDDDGDGGGAGGGFATAGGRGGAGLAGSGGAAASSTEGNDTLIPLRGGCQGGSGGHAAGRSAGGAGGGAIELSVSGTLTVSGSSARITASGGGGQTGEREEDGGGGGGSGGGVRLEAGTLNITGGWVTANGGGGGSGNATNSSNGNDGENGGIATTAPTDGAADDGSGGWDDDGTGGNGGNGAGASAGAGSGGDGQVFFFFITGAGGGGGGGGRGRIHYRAVSSCNLGGSSSPSATRSGVCP